MLRPLVLCVLAALSACSPPERSNEHAPKEVAAQATPTATARASAGAAASGGAVKIESDDGVLEFAYSHPAEVGAIPALAAALATERDEALAEARRDAREDRASAKREGFEFHAHSLGIAWEVVTQTPRFLSLSNSFYTFTGGAHGNYGFEGLVWDRTEARRLAAIDLFTSPQAFKSALLKPFCAGLDTERRKKGIEPSEADDTVFPRCIDPVREATVILGSSNKRKIDRIGFLIDPYVAGSYAEGEYEVTLPVTPAVLAAVKPEYRDAFALR